MKKVNALIDNNIDKLFIVFLLIQPFLDLLRGVSDSLSFIDYGIRLIFLISIVYYLLIIKKSFRVYMLLLLVYIFFYYMINVIPTNTDNYFEFRNLIKIIYFPIMVSFSWEYFKNRDVDIKYISIIFITYTLLIIVPNVLNIGYDSYSYSKVGSAGLFRNPNAIGNILSCLLPIFIVWILKDKNKIFVLGALAVYIVVILTMGTKTPLLSFVIYLLYLFILFNVKLVRNKKVKTLGIEIMLLIAFFVTVFILLPYTPFYKNLVIHLKFLKINSFKDLITFRNIDHFLFGERFKFLGKSLQIYKNSNVWHKFFGIGYTLNDMFYKTSEMDYFIVLVHHGLVGFVLVLGLYFKIIVDIFKSYFGKFRYNVKDFVKSSYMISLVLTMLSAFFVGHVITEGSALVVCALILGLNYKCTLHKKY